MSAPQQPPSPRAARTAFVPALPSLPTACPPRTRACPTCSARAPLTRRALLRRSLQAAAAAVFGASASAARAADAVQDKPNESVCANCQGSGKVPCDLCSGTGFWRALGGADPKQRYQGVVCPECEGVGELRCPVCLGTGEGSVRGLLRRRRVEPGPGRILQSN